MTELEKMISGKIYDCKSDEIGILSAKAHRLCNEYNTLNDDNPRRKQIIEELIPNNNGVYLQGPIHFDYGIFTSFGKNCYANFNLTVLDTSPVTIGDNVFFGPNVSIVTPIHPLLAEERNLYQREDGVWTDKEYSKPITIKSNCWICSNVTICGGVTIGENSVIGAGSVVIKDIPDGVLACGNPCRVIRKITKEDSIYLKKELF